MRRLRHRLRFVQVGSGIAGLNHLKGHGACTITRRESVNCGRNLRGAMLKLALKLADEERGLLLIALLKNVADTDEHSPRNGGDGGGDREREKQQELLAEAHCASSSEAEARSGDPSACRRRSRRRVPMAQARGKSRSGITVWRSRKSLSIL